MGRKKAQAVRKVAEHRGWLDPSAALPDEGTLCEVLGKKTLRPQCSSLVERHRAEVSSWWEEGIQGTTIHQALVRSYGF